MPQTFVFVHCSLPVCCSHKLIHFLLATQVKPVFTTVIRLSDEVCSQSDRSVHRRDGYRRGQPEAFGVIMFPEDIVLYFFYV